MEFWRCGIDHAGGLDGHVAVVVDVFRAFTTAAYAFDHGVAHLVLVDGVEEAVRRGDDHPGALLLKDGRPDPRFDLTNSPAQLREHDLQGRVIVQCTAAGTRGAVAAQEADVVWCTGFATASATARQLQELHHDRGALVITGSDGAAEEDLACADYIEALAHGDVADPTPFVARAARSETAARLREGLRAGYPGVAAADIDLCLDVDRFAFAMRARPVAGHLRLERWDAAGGDA